MSNVISRTNHVNVWALLVELSRVGHGYAVAIAKTRSGSTYEVTMGPSSTYTRVESGTIGNRVINTGDVRLHEGRLHVRGCDPADSVTTSEVVEFRVFTR